MLNFFDKFPMLFESRMNLKYKKIFSIIAFLLTTLFFLGENVFGKVLAITNNSQANNEFYVVTSSIEPLIYVLGVFMLFIMVGGAVFIGIGEVYIRICEYFNIKSKLYNYMTKTKDVMTMSDFNYYEKYKNDEKEISDKKE